MLALGVPQDCHEKRTCSDWRSSSIRWSIVSASVVRRLARHVASSARTQSGDVAVPRRWTSSSSRPKLQRLCVDRPGDLNGMQGDRVLADGDGFVELAPPESEHHVDATTTGDSGSAACAPLSRGRVEPAECAVEHAQPDARGCHGRFFVDGPQEFRFDRRLVNMCRPRRDYTAARASTREVGPMVRFEKALHRVGRMLNVASVRKEAESPRTPGSLTDTGSRVFESIDACSGASLLVQKCQPLRTSSSERHVERVTDLRPIADHFPSWTALTSPTVTSTVCCETRIPSPSAGHQSCDPFAVDGTNTRIA